MKDKTAGRFLMEGKDSRPHAVQGIPPFHKKSEGSNSIAIGLKGVLRRKRNRKNKGGPIQEKGH